MVNGNSDNDLQREFKFLAFLNFTENNLFLKDYHYSAESYNSIETKHYIGMPHKLSKLFFRFEQKLERVLFEIYGEGISVKITGHNIGSLSIFFSVLAVYDIVSKYKNFSDSLSRIIEDSASILNGVFSEYKPYNIMILQNNDPHCVTNDKIESIRTPPPPGNKFPKLIPTTSNVQIFFLLCIVAILLYEVSKLSTPQNNISNLDKLVEIKMSADEAKRISEENRLQLIEHRLLTKLEAQRTMDIEKITSSIEELTKTIKDSRYKTKR
jgi:hypothetical protein